MTVPLGDASSVARGAGRMPVLLCYRTLGLGDLLTAVPALRALREAFPDHHHVLATPAPLAPLVRLLGAVDEHLPLTELAPVPPRPVDIAVNLHGAGPQSHLRLLDASPLQLLAHRHPDAWPHRRAPVWDARLHEVARWCRLLESAGIAADPDQLAIAPPQEETVAWARGATIVHPGAKAVARRWPPERFAAVARSQALAGRRVLVTGSAGERGLADAVARTAGLPAAAVLAGEIDLGRLAAIVAVAGRVVCGDTGLAHLATALGTPSVVLFGPTPPDRWGPPAQRRDRHRVVWAGASGDPAATTTDPGLLRIPVRAVLEELAALDRSVSGDPVATP